MPSWNSGARGFFRIAAVLISALILNGKNAKAAPVADFTASAVTICVNATVSFTSISSGSITSYSWNFGSGASPATSTASGPVSVTYSTSGLKTISLTVTAADGTDTKTKTDYILVNASAPAMSGSITGSTAVCASATNVNYSITAIANAASYLWTVPSGCSIVSGSGTNSIGVNFGSTSGNVCVSASNGCGSSTQVCKAVNVGTDLVRIMTYNLLNYPDGGNLTTDTSTRNPYFRTTIAAADPDILATQEVTSLNGVNIFLNNVMNANGNVYAAGTFIDGFDSDNAIFYKSSKFTFVSNTRYRTDLRDINEFKLVHILSGDTLRIYSVHLKASAGTTEEAQRALEVDSLRKVTNALPAGSKFIVLGDFNIYKSGESAYQKLIAVDPANEGHFIDALSLTGTWNNSTYAPYHTQSTRTRAFNGGSTGGLDDRFDMILFSKAIQQGTSVSYVANSMTAFGNDGNHYGDSINQQPNTAVSSAVANALHYSADHLPVFATFKFENASCPYADLGVSAIVSPTEPACADANTVLQIQLKNYGSNSVNFSTNNLQVTLNVTLPNNSVQSFSKIISSGILASLATQTIAFDNTLNMSATGAYSFSASTVFSGDTIASNNSTTATVNVYSNAVKTISANGPTSFCVGGNVTLSADASPGISYQWQRNSTDISGATSASYVVNQSGTYRCVEQKTTVASITKPSRTLSNNNTFSIPDNSCTPATSIISVTGYTGNVSTTGISIKININHTWVGDLVFYLEAPNGDRLGLSNRTGNNSNNGDNFTNTIFTDLASTTLPTTGAPYTNSFKPWGSTFTVCSISTTKTSFGGIGNGSINPNGSWKLIVYDRASTDVGSIVNWQITFPAYTVPYTLVCDPVISDSVVVTVNNPPAITISPAIASVCNSGSVTLTASGASTYAWSPSTGLNTTSGSVVTATISNPIIYTVTGTDAIGCSNTATKQIAVNTSPSVSLTVPTAVCINSASISLTGGSPAGGIYSGPGVSGSTFNPSVAGAGAKQITYTYTDNNGCSASATATTTVNNLPAAVVSPSGSIVICQGSSVQLSGSGGTSYLWSTGETSSSISVSNAGNYSVRVTDAIGCSSTSSTVNVTVSAFQMNGTVFNETLGSPTATTSIASYTGYSSTGLGFFGNADIRSSSASTNYTGASGSGNVFFTNTTVTKFVIYKINTLGLSNLQLSFGILKTTTASNGSDFLVQVSTDSINYTTLSFTALPTGTGTAVWTNRTISSGIPSASRLFIQFINTSTTTQYRIDDIILRYANTAPTISASGSTTFCQGGSVSLTASTALNYLWNTGETTQTIQATTSGTRFCSITGDNGCIATTNAVNVSVNPSIFTITGGGSYCSGGNGVAVGLSSSETGVNYQLKLNTSNVGNAIAGTGNALSFGNQTVAGTYTILATNPSLSCAATMNGTATIVQNVLPNVFTVTGGGNYCSGGTGVTIGLSGSQAGVTYQLYFNGNPTGISLNGTGSALNFGLIQTAGTYTVIATNQNNCSVSMSGQTTVGIQALPTVFAVTGGGNFCSGGNGVSISLSGSQNGFQYLLRNNNSTLATLTGTGSPLNFNAVNVSGTFTVQAINPATSCSSTMSGNATIEILSLPFIYNVTGGGDYCSAPGTGVQIGLSHSDSLVSYQLYYGSTSVGNAIAGIESAISFGSFTSTGTYSVIATSANGCTSLMNANAIVSVDPATTWFIDSDGDGFGTSSTTIISCEQPAGYVINNFDCNDLNINVYPGALEICGNGIDDDCDGFTDEDCSPTLNVKLYLQGFYSNGQMISLLGNGITDTITISLASSVAPHSILYSVITTVQANGNSSATFPLNALGGNYYLVIDHRQSLQIWSGQSFQFTAGMQLDLTQSANAVYGNNLIALTSGVYGIVTGDINRDGIISIADLNQFEQQSLLFPTGYILEDLNGDGIAESADFSLLENNIGWTSFRP